MITWPIAFLVFSNVIGWVTNRAALPWNPRQWRFRLSHLQVAIALCAYFLAIVKAGPGQEGVLILVAVLACLALFLRLWVREFRRFLALPDRAFRDGASRTYWIVMLTLLAPIGLWLFRSTYPQPLFPQGSHHDV